MSLNKLLIIGVVAFLGMATFVGCRKKEDTIAKIYVRDADNNPVAGAQVRLYGQSTTPELNEVALDTLSSSNSAGEAVFNFNEVYQLGQAGVAVLDIQVTATDGKTGQGIIKVEEETTSEKTVFVQ